MATLNKDNLVFLVRAYYDGYIRFTFDLPAGPELLLLRNGLIEAKEAQVDLGEDHIRTMFRISVTDKGRSFFEDMSRLERVNTLIDIGYFSWASVEIHSLSEEELPSLLAHENKRIRTSAKVRSQTLEALAQMAAVSDRGAQL